MEEFKRIVLVSIHFTSPVPASFILSCPSISLAQLQRSEH